MLQLDAAGGYDLGRGRKKNQGGAAGHVWWLHGVYGVGWEEMRQQGRKRAN